jgi:hypothetical protein
MFFEFSTLSFNMAYQGHFLLVLVLKIVLFELRLFSFLLTVLALEQTNPDSSLREVVTVLLRTTQSLIYNGM